VHYGSAFPFFHPIPPCGLPSRRDRATFPEEGGKELLLLNAWKFIAKGMPENKKPLTFW